MTLEDAIHERLTSTADIMSRVGARIYHGVRPPHSGMPCVTFLRLDTIPINGSTGPSDTNNVHFQFDSWASDVTVARSIATAIKDALKTFTKTSDPEISSIRLRSDQEMPEWPEGEGYPEWRVQQDYSVWTTAS